MTLKMMKMTISERLGSSFRDPSGFLFSRDGILYRQINHSYGENYDLLKSSGLYDKLVKVGRLVPHREVDINPAEPDQCYKVILPETVHFISYPYEWSFGELKEAALATLSIQKHALKFGLSLKDSSAFNIQFYRGKATLIDTLSLEKYNEGEPWVAYRQFCQHFLGPLALMAYRDFRLSQLMRVYIDGIPLDLTSRLLPGLAWFNFGLFSHIFLHAKAQASYAGKAVNHARTSSSRMSKLAMEGLIESLRSTLKRLKWKPRGTEWGNYYESNNYSDAAFIHKKQLVSEWMERIKPKSTWDLGANTGVFSRLATKTGSYTVAFDADPVAVEQNYIQVKKEKETLILPLVLDLTNPSPAIGWKNQERRSFMERGPADVILALALIHHLAISNNVPLPQIADFFSTQCRWLVIEFVPKTDSQVQKLLASREDIFDRYNRAEFERVFQERFKIHETVKVHESERTLYLMESGFSARK